MNGLRAACATALLASIVAGCGAADGPQVEPLALDPAAPARFGHFLEGMAPTGEPASRARRGLRSRASNGWKPGYQAIELASGDPGDAPLAATLHGARPPGRADWRYRCEAGADVSLFWWLFSGEGAGPEATLRLEAGGRTFPLALPRAPARLAAYELVLGGDFCRGGGTDARVELVSSALPPGLRMSEPQLLVADEASPPPVILISLDTLRADYWEHERTRPPELAAFARDSIRYRRAYTAAPSTWPAHSVMLSGLYLDQIEQHPIWELPSIAGDQRARGYPTLAFVAGGYVRARFGYPVRAAGRAQPRAPGFALGFDLYLEGRHRPADVRDARLSESDALARERLLESVRYSLAGALERSLRWWRALPGVAAFHLVHGYDVHEYRSVPRAYWEAAWAAREARADDPEAARGCAERSGALADDELVVLPSGWPADGPCGPLVLSILYEARVRSVEDALARYLGELRALGVYDRALIAVTSDHGEGLLDESGQWGHSMLLANNLHVPLWIKPPGSRGDGRVEERVTGLVELRGLLARLASPPGSEGSGRDTGGAPLRFADAWSSGLVLPDGSLCRWSPPGRTLAVRLAGEWRPPTGEQAVRCERAEAAARSAAQRVPEQAVPPELSDELRALGYVE